MNDQIAFIGDVHGNFDALRGVLDALASTGPSHMVFLGDYLNKGPRSADVLDLLLTQQRVGSATLLAGNHETALLAALDTNDITSFLKMGGAVTIKSYLGRPVRPEVLDDFRAHLPSSHVEGLRAMPRVWASDEVLAQHAPSESVDGRFSISAHVPVGLMPRIGRTGAMLDTGSGSNGDHGRLTALLWPSLRYLQVDAAGRRVDDASRL